MRRTHLANLLTVVSILAVGLGSDFGFAALPNGAPPPSIGIPSHVRHISVPPYLYHWTTQSGLMELENLQMSAWYRGRFGNDPGSIPLKSVTTAFSGLGFLQGAFFSIAGLFATSNPLAGMGTDGEAYAKRGGQTGAARLVVIKPKATAKIQVVFSSVNPNENARHLVEQVTGDLVFHVHFNRKGKPAFQEWLILNPEAIENFSASPDIVREHLARAVEEFKLNKQFKPSELHHFDLEERPLPSNAELLMREAVFEESASIPKMFMRSFSIHKTCREILERL